MAFALRLSETPSVSAFDPVRRMRCGDASAWPRYRAEPLPSSEVIGAWTAAARRRGEPGYPSALRVYTHFTYCESSCSFCMYWHQVPQAQGAYAHYVDHLIGSIDRFQRGAGRTSVSSAYVGGGTPSATPYEDLARYFSAFSAAFQVEGEYTFEAHPRTMDVAKVELAHAHGVNRISMGVQSLEPEVLRGITRKNAPLEAIAELVSTARKLGIVVNLDLVLGLPGQTLDSFRSDLGRLTTIGPDVVTLYRYQSVPRLAHEPPREMHYDRAFSEETAALIERHGYRIGDPVHEGAGTVRLLRSDAPGRDAQYSPYALFDAEPSHLIGLGPGAYGHAFGYGWFRDVTSMERLDEPAYWGTRMSTLDECRTIVLDAMASQRQLEPAALEAASGVDIEAAFAEPLSWAHAAGALTAHRGRLSFGELPGDVHERIVDALMPSPPREALAPDSFQPELVPLRVTRKEAIDPELVRAWCEAIGVPERGRRLFGAVVRDVDDRSVYFGVRGAGAPLRVHVSPPGMGKSYFETPRFAISYSNRPGEPIRAEEQEFLAKLAAVMKERS